MSCGGGCDDCGCKDETKPPSQSVIDEAMEIVAAYLEDDSVDLAYKAFVANALREIIRGKTSNA